MKKQILAFLAAATMLSPIAVHARTSPRELHRDAHEIREEQQDLRQAKRNGTPAQIRDARGEVHEAKHEYREDRRDYRPGYRANYHAVSFRAPFAYHLFNVGVRLSPQYFGSHYVVNNYASQRLPALYPNQRYVRHYNDLLLVNVRSGTVLKVYRGFYW